MKNKIGLSEQKITSLSTSGIYIKCENDAKEAEARLGLIVGNKYNILNLDPNDVNIKSLTRFNSIKGTSITEEELLKELNLNNIEYLGVGVVEGMNLPAMLFRKEEEQKKRWIASYNIIIEPAK